MLSNASEEEKVAIKQLQQEKNKELRLKKKAESIKQARKQFARNEDKKYIERSVFGLMKPSAITALGMLLGFLFLEQCIE